MSVCSQAGAQFDERTCDLQATAKSNYVLLSHDFFMLDEMIRLPHPVTCILPDSLLVDHESGKETELMSTLFLDHLKTMQDNHTKGISDVRNLANKCLLHDYLVCFQLSFPYQSSDMQNNDKVILELMNLVEFP